jgi:CheY-like chemotaxis protein
MSPSRFLIGVVDDDPRVLESLEELLSSGGYQVLPFYSGEAFLASGGFRVVDCLITDIEMPVVDGWELLRIARMDYRDLPVILITAINLEERGQLLDAQAARRVFKKPFDGRELLRVLGDILG